MTGFHVTSYQNWMQIRRHGLQPQRLTDHEQSIQIAAGVTYPIIAIWLWKKRLDLESRWASAFWHAQHKKVDRVVMLRVQYMGCDIWRTPNGSWVSIDHHIDFEGMHFYENSKATLLGRRIPPSRVKLCCSFDFRGKVQFSTGASG